MARRPPRDSRDRDGSRGRDLKRRRDSRGGSRNRDRDGRRDSDRRRDRDRSRSRDRDRTDRRADSKDDRRADSYDDRKSKRQRRFSLDQRFGQLVAVSSVTETDQEKFDRLGRDDLLRKVADAKALQKSAADRREEFLNDPIARG